MIPQMLSRAIDFSLLIGIFACKAAVGLMVA